MYQLKPGESDCTQQILREFENRPNYCRDSNKWANKIPKKVNPELMGQMYEYVGTGIEEKRYSNVLIYGLQQLSTERKKILIHMLYAGKLRVIHTITDQYLITC